MNWHKIHQVMACTGIITILLIPQRTVSAQAPHFVEIPIDDLNTRQPIELHGLISSQTLSIPIPRSWSSGDDNWIEIQLRASPLLDAARSSITVSLNDRLLISDHLDAITQNPQQITIPADTLAKGNNTLTFSGVLYLPDDPETSCQNWDDPARWLVVEPGGILHVSFAKDNSPMDLASFPEGFVEPLEEYLPEKSREPTLFVLPAETTPDDLTSLSTISYVLGSYASAAENWNPEIIDEAHFSNRTALNRNIIFIGRAPEHLQVEKEQNQDFISLLPSPWGVGNVVMIIADQNRQDGFSPASVFSDPTRSILLHGNLAYVRPEPLPAPRPFPHDFTFQDLGYLDRTIKGMGQQNLIYRLYIPYDIEPARVKLHLRLVHSPGLDIHNSSFTVYLNGFSVAGVLPGSQTSPTEPITVGLPARSLKPGVNFIRVSFDLHVAQGSCERALESVWATLLNTSSFELSFRKRTPIPSLENFPLPFSDSPGSLLVIPDHFQSRELARISQLAFMLGAVAGREHHPPEVMTSGKFLGETTQHRNIILIGLPAENPATMRSNDLLPQPFGKDGHSLQEGYGVRLPTPNQQASLGLVQILPSPWIRGGTLLVLTGNDAQGMDWTWNILLDPALRNQFAGNLMVVGSANRSQSAGGTSAASGLQALFQQVPHAGNIPFIGPLLQSSGQDLMIPVSVGGALILTVAVWWLFRVIRTRNETSPAVKKEELDENE